jgi:thiamine biosynthesis protein ThiS
MTAAQSLEICVNGEPRRVPGGLTIGEMLGELGLDARKVAVERNLEIVPRSTLSEVRVADGDAFEIVHFVGGG